jgi:hypothetical protein
MKTSAFLTASCALMAFTPFYAQAGAAKSNATTTILPNARIRWREKLPAARGRVCQRHTTGPVEYFSVYVTGLPPNTDFDFFISNASGAALSPRRLV